MQSPGLHFHEGFLGAVTVLLSGLLLGDSCSIDLMPSCEFSQVIFLALIFFVLTYKTQKV